MIYIYPPSPALSACDSLDGIDDLDAYLDAQGPLSRFGTPPLAKETPKFDIQDCFVEDELADDAIAIDYSNVAVLFAQKAYTAAPPTARETEHIRDMLLDAKLPAEIIALSYNVILQYEALRRLHSDSSSEAGDLLVVSAMALAVMSASDHPPKSSWWSVIVCNGIRAASEIDRAIIKLLASLDWSLHKLCSPTAIEQAVELLTTGPSEKPLARPQTPVTKTEPMKISLQGTGAV